MIQVVHWLLDLFLIHTANYYMNQNDGLKVYKAVDVLVKHNSFVHWTEIQQRKKVNKPLASVC